MGDLFQSDYEQLAIVASLFSKEAENTTNLLTNLRQAFAPLQQGAWIGEGAKEFFNDMNAALFPAVQRLLTALEAGAELTTQVSELIRAAEEEAAGVFDGIAEGGGAGVSADASGQGGAGSGAVEETGGGTSQPVGPPEPLGLPPRPPAPPQPSQGDGSGAHGTDSPGISDYANRELFYKVADAADGLGMDNAARNMRHYLNNSGEPLDVSPEQMLNDLPGLRDSSNATFEHEVVGAINERIANEYNGQPMTFQLTTDWNPYYATKGESQDWFYGVGGFSYSYGAEVTVTPGADGKPHVAVNYQMHVFDRYNWDNGKGVNIGPWRIGDAQLGRLHTAGLAQEYEVWGSSQPQHHTYTYEGASGSGSPPWEPGESPDTRRDSTRRDPDGTRRWGRGDGR